jgi:hypothetical protein
LIVRKLRYRFTEPVLNPPSNKYTSAELCPTLLLAPNAPVENLTTFDALMHESDHILTNGSLEEIESYCMDLKRLHEKIDSKLFVIKR